MGIALWGFFYCASCYASLTSVEGPVHYRFEANGKQLDLFANHFSYQPQSGFLRASGIKLVDASSDSLLTVAMLDAQGVSPRGISKTEPISVRASGVSGHLVRTKEGKFSILDYFPTNKEPPTEYPISLDLKDVSLAFDDYSSAAPLHQVVATPRVKLDVFGAHWVAQSRASLQGIGVIDLQARGLAQGNVEIDGAFRQLDGAKALQLFQGLKEARKVDWLHKLSVSALRLGGTAHGSYRTNEPFQLTANLEAIASNLSYGQDYKAKVATFQGLVTEGGARGVLTAVSPEGLSADYDATVDWAKEVHLGGHLQAAALSTRQLTPWLRRLMPAESSFSDAAFSGWLGYAGALQLDGRLKAKQFSFAREVFDRPNLVVDLDDRYLKARVESAYWMNEPLQGAIAYALGGGQLSGVVASPRVDLARFGTRFSTQGLTGIASVQGLISGSIKNPLVRIVANGNALAHPDGGQLVDLGVFQASLSFNGKQVELHRLSLKGKNGVAAVSGTWNVAKDKLNLDLLVSGLPLEAFSSEVKGQASLKGVITGSLKDPKGKGALEVINGRYQDQIVPILQASWLANKQEFQATNFEAVRGAGKIQGAVAVNLRNRQLHGEVDGSGIQLSELFGKEFSGILGISRGKVGGTIDNPQVDGHVAGTNLVAKGVKVDSLDASGTFANHTARIDALAARLGGGTLSASGSFNFDRHSGSFEAKANDISAEDLLATVSPEFDIRARLNGEVSAQIVDSKPRLIEATGNLDKVAVNGVFFGEGPWTLSFSGSKWIGSASIGELERFIEVPSFSYDTSSKKIDGSLSSLNFRLEDVYSALTARYQAEGQRKPLLELNDAVREKLDTAKGTVNADIGFSGPIDNPDIDVRYLKSDDIAVAGKTGGKIDAKGSRTNGVWTVASLNVHGPGDFSSRGRIEEHGAIALDGELTHIDPDWLAAIDSRLAAFPGHTDLSYSVSGKTNSPIIDGSISYLDGTDLDRRQVDVLAKVKDGRITAEGSYFYKGFTGNLIANVPFKYPFEFPQDEEMVAEVTLPPRPLSELAALIPDLDPARTNGEVTGLLRVTGHPDDAKISGTASLSASTAALKSFQTALTDLSAKVNLKDNLVELQGSGKSSKGGSFEVSKITAQFGHLDDLFGQTVDSLLANPVAGNIVLQNLRIAEKTSQSETDVAVAGPINLSGTLKRPHVSTPTPLQLLGANILVPSEFEKNPLSSGPIIDPTFDIRAEIVEKAKLRGGTGSFDLGGNGALKGSLTYPEVNGSFLVQKGAISLPNARVIIEPGGTIQLLYKETPYGLPESRMDVDLEGRTGLTASAYGNLVERYDISLDIHGDLLKQGGLNLQARSDPAGLSQSQILNLLGQGDILTGGAASNTGVGFDRQLQNALTQIALPTFLESYTSRWASQLGVDYFAFDYNPFENVSFSIAKALGKDFMLSYRRQVNPTPGQKLRFDLRVSYRPRFKGEFFRHLTFSAGIDQDRPYKIAVEYSFRF